MLENVEQPGMKRVLLIPAMSKRLDGECPDLDRRRAPFQVEYRSEFFNKALWQRPDQIALGNRGQRRKNS
ncbi:hypothetical protein [Hoeflea poritis]|uniref:Uncharacterized protein n=1 Tax=Hoeflea poritis TaxID=2993659 RepID=A0ABT4VHL5_9HYPH|nr:hypothetical protein [Hoeflea poritis]MDA4844188.1 hypothetical protein [Hoeflea poritis]